MTNTLQIGCFTCDPDRTWFQIDRYGIRSHVNRLIKVRNQWTVWGSVNATQGVSGAAAQGQVNAKVLSLEAAVADGINLIFSLGSSMNLMSANCTEGTHIKEFSWLPGFDGVRGSGAEGVLRRTFKLVVFGDILVTGINNGITFWRESLRTVGNGGPHIIPVTSLNGVVTPQQLTSYTPFWIIQSGMARGLTGYPAPATPIYGAVPNVYYPPEKQSVETITPEQFGLNVNTEFGVRWSYSCWSSYALLGNPSLFT